MRRKDKQILDKNKIEAIILDNNVLRLGLANDNIPYVVPLNYAYQDGVFYLHSAREGRKLDMIKKNPHVCFEIDYKHQVIEGDIACKYTMAYQSIIGYGQAEIVKDMEDIRQGLKILMTNFSDQAFTFSDKMLKAVSLIKIHVEEMTAKGKVPVMKE